MQSIHDTQSTNDPQKCIRTQKWVDDNSILFDKVHEILTEVSKKLLEMHYGCFNGPDHVKLLSQQIQWIEAFTHKSVNAKFNNSLLGCTGSSLMLFLFSHYLKLVLSERVDAKTFCVLSQKYLSNKARYVLSVKLGIDVYVYQDVFASGRDEDTVLTSFFACLFDIGEEYSVGGYPWCIACLALLFENTDININEPKNYKSQLKEYYDAQGWNQPIYRYSETDKGYLVKIIEKGGRI